MYRKFAALALALVAAALVACGGRSSGGGMLPSSGQMTLPAIDDDLSVTAVLPRHMIGEELPDAGLGTIKMPYWHAVVGGFTQTKYSQTLWFPPGTKITIKNLSKDTPHTLNVVKQISGHDASFPKSPNLSAAPHGNGKLTIGYASGTIQPGKSITVTLVKAGTYLIGCAFHYKFGMRDILNVSPKGKPGPQATPPSNTGPSPSPTDSGGGGGWAPTH